MIQPVLPIPYSDGDPPTEIRLFAAGDNATTKGTIAFTARSAKLIEREYVARGVEKFADYEHRSLLPLDRQPEHATDAAAWYRLDVRDGALWATDIRWTPRAAQKVRERELRYFSPAVEIDPKTREVVRFVNFALTNDPATLNLPALVAASEGVPMDEMMQKCAEAMKSCLSAMESGDAEAMKTSMAALKTALAEAMPEEPKAEEPKVEIEMEKATALSAAVVSLTGKDSVDEQVGALHALKATAGQVAALSARVAELEGEVVGGKLEAVIRAGAEGKKLSPADLAGETDLGKVVKGFVEARNLVALSALVGALPAKVAVAEVKAPETQGIQLSAEEAEIDRAFGRAPGWDKKVNQ